MSQTFSQKYSEKSWKAVRDAKDNNDRLKEDFVTRARHFPALVHHCGAAQALSFLASKGYNDYLSCLAQVLELAPTENLQEIVRTCSLSEYMHWTRRIQDAAQWIKRSVDAQGAQEG